MFNTTFMDSTYKSVIIKCASNYNAFICIKLIEH